MKLDFVIFGGVGDLSLRKLLPSLYYLFRDGKLPDECRILCVSRADETQENFHERVRNKVSGFLGGKFDDGVWEKYQKILSYVKVDLNQSEDWKKLSDTLDIDEADENRLIVYYLSVPPVLFPTVCQQIDEHRLNPAFSRLVVEKPLGEDFKSAQNINQLLSKSFDEKQIYRIDHYLGKYALQNILKLRANHTALECMWNNEFVRQVDLTVSETVGVEGRVEFLDRIGVLRDTIQNHVMQMLCLIAMELPKKSAVDDIRDQKVKVVNSLVPIDENNAVENAMRAQYVSGEINGVTVLGYLEELAPHMGKVDGSGETLVEIKAGLDNERWQGVPFYLKTGKRLSERKAEIVLHLNTIKNEFIKIEIQPNIKFSTNSSMAGLSDIEINFNNNERIPEAYEFLIHEIIKGNQEHFVRDDEIMASWKWIDAIRAAWTNESQEMLNYKAGSSGPKRV